MTPNLIKNLTLNQVQGKTKKSRSAGFSFTEVMLTMALFILLAGVGVGAYFRYYTFSMASADINKSLTFIKQARFRALKNPDSSDYGIHLDVPCKCLIAFKDSYNPADPQNIAERSIDLTVLEATEDALLAEVLFLEESLGE